MGIPAFILSTLGTVCICITPLLKGKNMKLILFLIFLTNVLIATSYILTGAFNGAATCCVAAVQAIINYFFERKSKRIPVWLIAIYAVAFVIVNVLVFSHITDIIALVAALMFIIVICQKNGKHYRLWTLAKTVLWAVYDLITLSFGPLCTHVIEIAIVIFGIVMHDRKDKTA